MCTGVHRRCRSVRKCLWLERQNSTWSQTGTGSVYRPWGGEGRSPPLSSSSAAAPRCRSSCLGGRRRGDSCLQPRRSDPLLTRSRTERCRSDPAPASAGAAGGVRFVQPPGANGVVRVPEGEGGELRWSSAMTMKGLQYEV